MSSPSPTNPFKLGESVPRSVPGAKPVSHPSPTLPKTLDVPKLPAANRQAPGMPGQVTAKNNPGSLADPDFTKKAMEPGSSYKSMFSDVRAKSADLQATHAAERAATPPPSRVADFARGAGGAGGAGGVAPKAASNLAAPAAGGAAPIAGLLLAPEGAAATAGATAGASASTPMLSLGSSGLGAASSAASSAASTAAAAAATQPPKPATAEELVAKGLSSTEEAQVAPAAAGQPEAAAPSLLDSLSDGAGAGGGGGGAPEDPESMGALLDSLMGPMPTE